MNGSKGHVVVVGSGVIGASCAYFLARDGWRVTIIDQGEFGRGCSHGNCGFVCPSHVLPLAVPGAVRGALKALFTPHSPLSIKPRLDFSLWGLALPLCAALQHRADAGGRQRDPGLAQLLAAALPCPA